MPLEASLATATSASIRDEKVVNTMAVMTEH
jgi:hypothetical protein